MLFVGLGSLWWFHEGRGLGVEYEAYPYTIKTAVLSFLFGAAVGGALALSRRTGSLSLNVAANLLLFVWALTFAFPYLGELP
jgi:hypothetical protein